MMQGMKQNPKAPMLEAALRTTTSPLGAGAVVTSVVVVAEDVVRVEDDVVVDVPVVVVVVMVVAVVVGIEVGCSFLCTLTS
mmetsp:Transcript_101109/g.291032  ORF Transcript_101109/g.291032 Transcript_101109/m.291032 type:complete len:81 (-) Transcript_101109:1392-1634(-)